jgi:hypothetical protein
VIVLLYIGLLTSFSLNVSLLLRRESPPPPLASFQVTGSKSVPGYSEKKGGWGSRCHRGFFSQKNFILVPSFFCLTNQAQLIFFLRKYS